MINISRRLLDITNHLDGNENILDVGCDHGLLAIYLVKNMNYVLIHVSDNKQSALNNAINNIKKYQLEKNIKYYLGNGLDVLNDKSIDTLIISGMGTSTILNILKNTKLKQIKKIIIQSNNHHYKLRLGLEKINYQLDKETVVYDKNKYYITMTYNKGKNKLDELKLKYGIHNNIDYLNHLLKKMKDIYHKNKDLQLNIDIEKLKLLIDSLKI